MKRIISILLLFFAILLCSQQTTTQKELLKRVENNHKLLSQNPEEAFKEAEKIAKEAENSGAHEIELKAITTQSVYYRNNSDFKNMMITANSLLKKAITYNNPLYQSIARFHLFEVYSFNDLYDKAFVELSEGLKLVEKFDSQDSLSTIVKLNLFASGQNYYLLQKDFDNQLKYIRLYEREVEKLSDEDFKQRLRYIHYSNLGAYYIYMNKIDSAKYYAELSLSKDKGYGRDDVQFFNLMNLGYVALKQQDYKTALSYFKQAESINYNNHINIENLYENIIEVYGRLHDVENSKKYKLKRDSLKLNVSENQNKSLHSLLDEQSNKNNHKIYYIFIGVFSLMAIVMILVIRKNRILIKHEKISQKYLDENSINQESQGYSELLEMFKKNDLAFMTRFTEVFPGFSQKLLEINPKMVQSEIEFCSLLKLKIPTKDIVRYRNIAHRTVQNKKYLIRKKLDIPANMDIYCWFEKI